MDRCCRGWSAIGRLFGAACATLLWLGGLAAAQPETDHYWALGAGYYQAIRSDHPSDEARWDWAVLSESNSGITPEWIREHLNRNLRLNPKQKYMVELTPLNHLGNPKRYAQQATVFDYHFKPAVREEILRRLSRTIRMILENIAQPSNVYGFSLIEEIPGNFGAGSQIACADDPAQIPPILEEFRSDIEKELGRPLAWDDSTRLWVGRILAQALEEIHRTIRAAAAGKKVIYWHHGGYTYLDERGQTLPADAPLATRGLYPAKWSDIVKPGLVDALMGWPEHPERFQRTLRLAERFNCPFFFQLSHPSVMRLNRWEEALANVKTRHRLNMGYFFYCEGHCNRGAWNDDPSFSSASDLNVHRASIPDHVRRFCAQENIGTDLIARCMAPQVSVQMALAKAKPGSIVPLDALIHNPATPQFFSRPEQATARQVRVTLDLPKGCRLQSQYSLPAAAFLGDLPPMSWRIVQWWVTVDEPPTPERYQVAITATSDNRPDTIQRYASDATIPSFEPHDIRRSGVQWAEHALGRSEVKPFAVFEVLGEPVFRPSVSDGLSEMAYEGRLSPGRKLVITPDGKGRIYPGALLPPIPLGARDPADPTGYKPFSEGYVAAGKALFRPLGDVRRVRVSVEGMAKGKVNSLCILQFAHPDGLKQISCLAGKFNDQWRQVAADVDVPEGATRLERILFYRAPTKAEGQVWYGQASVIAADLPATGQDVTQQVRGAAFCIPAHTFRVITYTDKNPPTELPRIRVQLLPEFSP